MTARDVWQAVALFVVVVAFLVGTAFLDAREERRAEEQREQTQEIACQILRSSILELQATERNGIISTRIAIELGLPVVFPPHIEIPEVPPECDGS
jgi:hypothetical protein